MGHFFSQSRVSKSNRVGLDRKDRIINPEDHDDVKTRSGSRHAEGSFFAIVKGLSSSDLARLVALRT